MATHLTEEEQVEALKRWWNENWVTLVLPIAVGVVLYVGWYWWQDHKVAQAEIASDKYEVLNEIVQAGAAAGGLTDLQKEEARVKAQGVVNDHANTLYADLSNLILGNLYLEDGDLDLAGNAINQVVLHGSNDAIRLLAQARLAKVYLSQERNAEALALVNQSQDPAYTSLFSEIRGDILLNQGDVAGANAAYQSALDSLDPQAFSRSGLLQAKISASAVPAETAESPSIEDVSAVKMQVEADVQGETE